MLGSWAVTNIGKKRLEGVPPRVAHANSSRAIVAIGGKLCVVAASNSASPGGVLWGFSVKRACPVASDRAVLTARGFSASEIALVKNLFSSAIAATKPSAKMRDGVSLQHNCPKSEALSREIHLYGHGRSPSAPERTCGRPVGSRLFALQELAARWNCTRHAMRWQS